MKNGVLDTTLKIIIEIKRTKDFLIFILDSIKFKIV